MYSKEEQKYRFNQFWDITNDRGEFSNNEAQTFVTGLNGYVKELNEVNLDYNKPTTQHKKFRHYQNNLILKRNKSGNRKMIMRLNNFKFNNSAR